MAKPIDIILSVEDRQEIERLLRVGKATVRVQNRARILLLSDRSKGGEWRSAPSIAQQLLVHANTVRNVRRRFRAEGLKAALEERPRPGAKPKLNGEVEAQLTLLACSDPPTGHAHWTLRLLADRLIELEVVDYVSRVTVGEWLKKTNLSLGR
jgi:transposase